MRSYTNLTKSPKGIAIKGGETVMVNPGQTSPPLDVNDADHAVVDKLGWFNVKDGGETEDVKPTKGPEDGSIANSTAVLEGNADPVTGELNDAPNDGLDELNDADLADLYTGLYDGKTPHHNAKRATIIAAIRAKQAGEAEAV